VHLLADGQRVCAVAAATADRLGEPRTEQARFGRLQVQLARQHARLLPLVGVRQHLAFGERAHRLS
jgi:hypothetical protein